MSPRNVRFGEGVWWATGGCATFSSCAATACPGYLKRLTRPPDQRLPTRQATPTTQTPPRTSTIHRAVPTRYRTPRRTSRPHARHPHRSRCRLATRQQRRLDHLRRQCQPPETRLRRGIQTVAISDFARARRPRPQRTSTRANRATGHHPRPLPPLRHHHGLPRKPVTTPTSLPGDTATNCVPGQHLGITRTSS